MALKKAHQKLKDTLQLLGKDTRDGLLTLPGIGAATRDKILVKRSEVADQGRSLRLTDVIQIEGIGQAKLARITGEARTKDVVKYATQYIKLFGRKVKMWRRYLILFWAWF